MSVPSERLLDTRRWRALKAELERLDEADPQVPGLEAEFRRLGEALDEHEPSPTADERRWAQEALRRRQDPNGEVQRTARAGVDHRAAMRRLAGCRCSNGGAVVALDVPVDGRGDVTFTGCPTCGARAERPGTVRENLAVRRRAIFRERARRIGLRIPARARTVCIAARRASSSGRPRGRRVRRAGPSRGPDPGPGGEPDPPRLAPEAGLGPAGDPR